MLDPTQQLLAVAWALGYVAKAGGTISDSFFITHPAAAQYAKSAAGDLIVGIDEFTRQRIRQVLAAIYEDPNVTERDVVAAIDNLFGGFSRYRAQTIARTEMAYAEGWGSSFAWREIGVEYVSITDGTDRDEPCIRADGQVWPLALYEQNILEHPNCTRTATSLSIEEVDISAVTWEH